MTMDTTLGEYNRKRYPDVYEKVLEENHHIIDAGLRHGRSPYAVAAAISWLSDETMTQSRAAARFDVGRTTIRKTCKWLEKQELKEEIEVWRKKNADPTNFTND